MITFKQFMEDRFLGEEEPAAVKVLLERDCGPFLRQRGSGFLYRGVKIDTGLPGTTSDHDGKDMDYIKKTVRTERNPKDMSKKRTAIVDEWFNEKFGIRARSNCVFAFGDRINESELKHYGTPCVIFPVGEFKFVWSRRVEDLYNEMDEYQEEGILAWLESKEYKTTDFDDAIHSRNEIMIQCSHYYAFPLEYEKTLRTALMTGSK